MVPKQVPHLANYSEPMKFVALGENHTVVLDAKGMVNNIYYICSILLIIE